MKSKSEKDSAIITAVNDALLGELEKKLHFRADFRIRFVGTVYDQELLKKIQENAGYFHGHTVGGTDLDLVLDGGFNREVGENAALYWTKKDGNLAKLIDKADGMSAEEIIELGKNAKARIRDAYSWGHIVDEYEKVFLSIKK